MGKARKAPTGSIPTPPPIMEGKGDGKRFRVDPGRNTPREVGKPRKGGSADDFGGRRGRPMPIIKRDRPVGYCPDPSMTVLMADGSYKKAGELVVGDLVKTYHEEDLKKASKKSLVLASGGAEKYSQIREQLESSYAKATLGEYKVEFVNIIKDVEKIKLTFEGSEIICSLSHKFYVNDSWKEAKELTAGDEVSGKKLISKEKVENGDVVFITIKDAHTYICEGLLSHNKSRRKLDDKEMERRKKLREDNDGRTMSEIMREKRRKRRERILERRRRRRGRGLFGGRGIRRTPRRRDDRPSGRTFLGGFIGRRSGRPL